MAVFAAAALHADHQAKSCNRRNAQGSTCSFYLSGISQYSMPWGVTSLSCWLGTLRRFAHSRVHQREIASCKEETGKEKTYEGVVTKSKLIFLLLNLCAHKFSKMSRLKKKVGSASWTFVVQSSMKSRLGVVPSRLKCFGYILAF